MYAESRTREPTALPGAFAGGGSQAIFTSSALWHWGIALGISTGALVHWHSGASADHCLICCVIVIRGARWVGGGYNNSALTN